MLCRGFTTCPTVRPQGLDLAGDRGGEWGTNRPAKTVEVRDLPVLYVNNYLHKYVLCLHAPVAGEVSGLGSQSSTP